MRPPHDPEKPWFRLQPYNHGGNDPFVKAGLKIGGITMIVGGGGTATYYYLGAYLLKMTQRYLGLGG